MDSSEGQTLESLYTYLAPTIARDAKYWSQRFPSAADATYDVLCQEGWIVAARVLRRYQASRGAAMTTVLSLALRRHFLWLARHAYRHRAHETLGMDVDHPDASNYRPRTRRSEQDGLALLATLTNDERRIATYLIDCNGSASEVFRQYGVPTRTVNRCRKAIQEKLT